MPKIGEIYNKKYELQELVGGGSYSEVYKAKEIKYGEIVIYLLTQLTLVTPTIKAIRYAPLSPK